MGRRSLILLWVAVGVLSFTLLLGLGDGAFQTQVVYAGGDGPGAVALSDVNSDGHVDIVTTNYDKLLEATYARHGALPPTYTFEDAADAAAGSTGGPSWFSSQEVLCWLRTSSTLVQQNAKCATRSQPKGSSIRNGAKDPMPMP